ncbi:CBS domain-containing protein [Candidatus Leptofilum sp.]|uniref:CBS domain-containing protein n=1 Tax=Candidatus Leptofilum sp. TaxID=3241576 RepID=UPI003B5CA7EB
MSLKEELMSERVSHLDLSKFCQIASGTAVRTALAEMRQSKTNVCLVTSGGKLVGIFTERDVLTKIATAPEKLDAPVNDIMTASPITVTPDTSAADALWLMDEKQFRNLPIVGRDGQIKGNMTHQAVISFLAARYPVEVLNRPPRPDQFPRKQEGG